MAYLFVTTDEYDLLGDVVTELSRDGVGARNIRLFSRRPERLRSLGVKTVRYRPPGQNMVIGAVAGASLGLAIGLLLMLPGFGITPLLVLTVALGIGGAVSRLWYGHGLAGELYRLGDAIRHGSAVMVLDVDADQVAPLERGLSRRHPELVVLGTDPGGTPPFP